MSSSCHLHPSAAAAAVSAAALPAAAPACQAPDSRYQMELLRPWWGIWAVIFCMTSQETNPPLKSKQPKASQSLLSPQSCPPPSRYKWLIGTGVLLLVGSGNGWSYNQRDACEANTKKLHTYCKQIRKTCPLGYSLVTAFSAFFSCLCVMHSLNTQCECSSYTHLILCQLVLFLWALRLQEDQPAWG